MALNSRGYLALEAGGHGVRQQIECAPSQEIARMWTIGRYPQWLLSPPACCLVRGYYTRRGYAPTPPGFALGFDRELLRSAAASCRKPGISDG